MNLDVEFYKFPYAKELKILSLFLKTLFVLAFIFLVY